MNASPRAINGVLVWVHSRGKVVFALITLLLGSLLVYVWLNSATEKSAIFSDDNESATGIEDPDPMTPYSGRNAPAIGSAAGHSAFQSREIDFSVPLRSQIQGLSLAADKGDANAVCRLVKSLEYCEGIDRMENAKETLLARFAEIQQNKESSDETIDMIIKREDAIQKAQAFCSDMSISIESELIRRLLQAAENGDIGAMERLLFEPPVMTDVSLSFAEAMLLYSKKAPKMLREMAFHGDMKAIQMLYEANSSGVMSTRFGEVRFDRDPDLHAAAADVLVEFGDSYVQKDVSERLASGTIKSAALTSRRSAQLRERMRKSVMGMANAKSPAALRDDPPIPACS